MECYACDQEATQRCPRCGKLYCADHGADFCAECLHPASTAPSTAVFRGSLLALLVGSVLALWLLIRPPGLPGESGSVVAPLPTERPEFQPPATPFATTTPQPTLAPTPTPTPTPAPQPPPETYIVQENDTLIGIAEALAPPGTDVFAYARQIADLNGIDFENPIIHLGQELKIPQPSQ